jgi:hypothetical protein
MKTFINTTSLVLSKLTAGQSVSTQGYTTAGDGGGASYLIQTPAQFGGTPDELRDHTIANGNIAVLQENGVVNDKQLGAASDRLILEDDVISWDFNGKIVKSTNVTFPATAVASSDANTLDDYEEGSWTPILGDGTNNATSSVAVGTYVKIGRLVHAKGRLSTTSLGLVSGSIRIRGLPFTTDDTAETFGTLSAGFASGFAIGAGSSVTGFVGLNTSSIFLQLWNAVTGTSAMQGTEWSDNGDLMFDAIFYTKE